MRVIAALLVGLSLAVGLAGCNKAGGPGAVGATDQGGMALGNPAAKVTVIEYASLGCPHCMEWNNNVFPLFKAKYIDSGKVHYVLREFLTGNVQIAAAGFLLAHCAGKDKYFQVVDAVFHHLDDMFAPGASPRSVLLNIAESAGMTEPQFDACVDNQAALTALNNRSDHYAKADHITGTPTFVINGKIYDQGAMTLAQLDQAIAQAEAPAK
ncbi:MAG TPA: DsbA family protein [Caulobacteraceae bacterium]|nr:DsbA family protein [Caulobacteraceae bacterium]